MCSEHNIRDLSRLAFERSCILRLTNVSLSISPCSSGFIDWPFMSTHFWGENPSGTWHLEVHNDAYSKYASEAKFFKWTLELLGTE